MLSAGAYEFIAVESNMEDCEAFDIVIADHRRAAEVASICEASKKLFGVIMVGGKTQADVVFPDDPQDRELRLASDLLFKIVRLRRERVASQQTQQMLTELAELDALTGVANRRAWDSELARRMNHERSGDGKLCVALLDLDHFKEINAAQGYATADLVLQRVATALKTSVRANDFVARIGGDEFGILLSNVTAEQARVVVDRIRESVTAATSSVGEFAVTATAGLAIRTTSTGSQDLFDLADRCLRQGKADGRNRTIASND